MQSQDISIDRRYQHVLPDRNIKINEKVIMDELGVPKELLDITVATKVNYWSNKPDFDEMIMNAMKKIILSEFDAGKLYLMKENMVVGLQHYMQNTIGLYMSPKDLDNILTKVMFAEEFTIVEGRINALHVAEREMLEKKTRAQVRKTQYTEDKESYVRSKQRFTRSEKEAFERRKQRERELEKEFEDEDETEEVTTVEPMELELEREPQLSSREMRMKRKAKKRDEKRRKQMFKPFEGSIIKTMPSEPLESRKLRRLELLDQQQMTPIQQRFVQGGGFWEYFTLVNGLSWAGVGASNMIGDAVTGAMMYGTRKVFSKKGSVIPNVISTITGIIAKYYSYKLVGPLIDHAMIGIRTIEQFGSALASIPYIDMIPGVKTVGTFIAYTGSILNFSIWGILGLSTLLSIGILSKVTYDFVIKLRERGIKKTGAQSLVIIVAIYAAMYMIDAAALVSIENRDPTMTILLEKAKEYPELTKFMIHLSTKLAGVPAKEAIKVLTESKDQPPLLISEDARREYIKFRKWNLANIFKRDERKLEQFINKEFEMVDDNLKECSAKMETVTTQIPQGSTIINDLKSCYDKETLTGPTFERGLCMKQCGDRPSFFNVREWFTYANCQKACRLKTPPSGIYEAKAAATCVGKVTYESVINYIEVETKVPSEEEYTGKIPFEDFKRVDPKIQQDMINTALGEKDIVSKISDYNPAHPIFLFGQLFRLVPKKWLYTSLTVSLITLLVGSGYVLSRIEGDGSVCNNARTFAFQNCAGDSLDYATVVKSINDPAYNTNLMCHYPDGWIKQFNNKGGNIISESWKKISKRIKNKDLREKYLKYLNGNYEIPDKELQHFREIHDNFTETISTMRVEFLEQLKILVPSEIRKKTEQFKKDKEKMKTVQEVGPQNTRWLLQNIHGDGNCFYRALANAYMFLTTKGYLPPWKGKFQDDLSTSIRGQVKIYVTNHVDETIYTDDNGTDYSIRQYVNNFYEPKNSYNEWYNNLGKNGTYIEGEIEILIASKLKLFNGVKIHVYDERNAEPYSAPINTYPSPEEGPIIKALNLLWNGKYDKSAHFRVLYPLHVVLPDDLPEEVDFIKNSDCQSILNEYKITIKELFKQMRLKYHPDKKEKKDKELYTKYFRIVNEKLNMCKDMAPENPAKRGGSQTLKKLSSKGKDLQQQVEQRMATIFP